MSAPEDPPTTPFQRVVASLLAPAGSDAQDAGTDALPRGVVLGAAGAGKTTLFSRAVAAAAAAAHAALPVAVTHVLTPLSARAALLPWPRQQQPQQQQQQQQQQQLVGVYEVAETALASTVLAHALPADVVKRRAAAAVIVVDGTKLDSAAQQLDKWLRLLAEHVTSLGLDADQREALVTASL